MTTKVYNIWPDCVAGNLHPVLCESASALYLFASLPLSVLTFAQCAEAVLICMLSCFYCQDNGTRTKVMETQAINFKLFPVAAKILISKALCFLTELHQTGGSVSPWTTMFLNFLVWSLSGVFQDEFYSFYTVHGSSLHIIHRPLLSLYADDIQLFLPVSSTTFLHHTYITASVLLYYYFLLLIPKTYWSSPGWTDHSCQLLILPVDSLPAMHHLWSFSFINTSAYL